MYSRELLDTILDRTDPLDVLNYCGVRISQQSSYEVRCACPIHNGDNDSAFSFDRRNKVFSCFSHNCLADKKRDVITFLIAVKKCSFKEAVEILAQLSGVELSEEQKFSINTFEYQYINQFNKTEQSTNKLKPISLPEVSISNLYNDGWLYVKKYLESPERNSSFEQVEEFGLYPGVDKFSHLRLYIPIHDELGRLVGLSGRKMDPILPYPTVKTRDGKIKVPPKYDNLSGLKKASVLYNLHRAKEYAFNGLIVVEGQFDAIRMVNYGYQNTVAKMGPVLSDHQAGLLYRYTTRVLLLVEDSKKIDPETGQILSLIHRDKNIDKLKYGMRVEVAYLDKDPDSSTKEEVDRAINSAELVKLT